MSAATDIDYKSETFSTSQSDLSVLFTYFTFLVIRCKKLFDSDLQYVADLMETFYCKFCAYMAAFHPTIESEL